MAHRASQPSDNVFISDLPAGIDETTLKATFEAFGVVVQQRILPAGPGANKVAALVRFDSVETATYVVSTANGQVLEGFEAPFGIRFADPPKGKGADRPGPYDAPQGKGYGAPKGGGGEVQLDNLYIKGLPANCGENEVRALFEQQGTISSCRVFAYPTHSAALVRFGSADEAKWVMDSMNGAVPDGLENALEIKFYESKVKGKGDAGKGGGGGKGGDSWTPVQKGAGAAPAWGKGGGKAVWSEQVKGTGSASWSMKELVMGFEKSGTLPGAAAPEGILYVSGLPPDAEDLDLYKVFNPFGALAPRGVRCMTHEDGSCKGFAFVNFQDPSAAQAAIQVLNATILPDGNLLAVKVKTEGGKGDKGKDKGKGKGKW